MKSGFIAGLILLTLSARPLFLMGREEFTRIKVLNRYELKGDYESSALIGKTEVRLSDAVPYAEAVNAEVNAPIRITIGKANHSNNAPVRIRPHYTDANRYHGSAALMRIFDKQEGVQYLVVIQNLGTGGVGPYEQHVRWRALWITDGGTVREDVFGYSDRSTPPIRTFLATMANPSSLGFYSNIMQGWPGLLWPILFPWISGALGILLSLIYGTKLILSRISTGRFNLTL
jgi:hypothetical protein